MLYAEFEEVSARGLAEAMQRREGMNGFLDIHTSTGLKVGPCCFCTLSSFCQTVLFQLCCFNSVEGPGQQQPPAAIEHVFVERLQTKT